jgi:hypothetical protein
MMAKWTLYFPLTIPLQYRHIDLASNSKYRNNETNKEKIIFYSDVCVSVFVYPETPIDYASSKIISGVKNLRKGLDPDVLTNNHSSCSFSIIEYIVSHFKRRIEHAYEKLIR